MKFTLSWLKSFLDTESSLDKIVNSLTMIGLEVEEIIDRKVELEDFEVAQILETSAHPDADKLKVCKVKTSSETLTIVCGAPNAIDGIKVALAKIGTIIPNGNFKIKQSKIRGIESCGMLCSREELNIKGDSSGIIELSEDAIIGNNIAEYFGLDDPVIHINVTPNRADSLGVYGIARDLAAAGIGTLKPLEIPIIKEEFSSDLEVKVLNEGACPLFTIREIKNLKNTESPKWLTQHLENIGVGSISAIVDITNYISYSFGQPMHAYDADTIKGNLIVDSLDKPEKMLALNDKEYELGLGDIIIKDDQEIHCLAGIIGGKNSSCNESTTRIILEAACFDSQYITRTGRKMMIDTDSRYRFERNVDREFTLKALDYATNLILTICGGKCSAPQITGNDKLPVRTIEFSCDFFISRAGFTIKEEEIIAILERLGFNCKKKKDKIEIIIPSWRYDVSIKEDIVEEIVRIYGYDKIPLVPLSTNNVQKIINREQRRFMDVKRLLASNGYTEVISWSFMDSKKAKLFSELKKELTLQNPISSDLDYMRPSILPNLLKIACNNINRSYKDLSLFELGPVFHEADNITPIKSVAGIRIGANLPKNCHIATQYVNIFDIKSDLETILAYASLELDKCQIQNVTPSYYHPTRSATVSLGKNTLAYFGQIHPSILKIFDIECNVMAFELNLSKLPMTKQKFGKKSQLRISDYQMINRDYAFIIDESQKIGEILNFIKKVNKNLIKAVSLFDIYDGTKIEKGKKSIAISVTIQDDNKTLTEEDINNVNKLIIEGVNTKFDACLREE
ncbi:MAG: phenylalanine--tRNA ligase subunit beta [Rickettsiaceae bacterium]